MSRVPLTSPLLSVLLFLAATCVWLRSAPRLGGHRGRTAGGALLLMAMASYANAYFAYLPRVGDVAGTPPWLVGHSVGQDSGAHLQLPAAAAERGAVVSMSVPGQRSGVGARSALVYLPPQYVTQPTSRFPTLYLLHGSPGVPLDWFRGAEAAEAGLAAARAGLPVIVVAPRMSAGWLDDSECVDGPLGRWETYLTEDVLPTVEARFRTWSSVHARGLAGNSSGGYCALTVGLRHPRLFGRVVALSPLTRPTYSYGDLAALFGHRVDLPVEVERHTPLWLLQHIPEARCVRLRLEVGRRDSIVGEDRRFVARDNKAGGHALLVLRDGGHTFRVWRPALRESLLWFARGALEGQPC